MNLVAGSDTTDPFAGVIGQPEAVARLTKAADNPVHAYMLLGRRGTGSFRAALGFAGLLLANAAEVNAVAVNAAKAGDDVDPSAARERAIRLAVEAKHPDLTIFEAEGAALRVSEADAIIKAGLRTPVETDRKVIVVIGVDAIEEAAIGKLLKVVEEPPPSTVFVLLADEVPPEIVTIASRCVPVEFGPVSQAELEATLFASGVEPKRAKMAAAAAAGDLDRARLLATDDALADRAELWRSVPDALDGTGFKVCTLVDQLREGMDSAQGPLEVRQATELSELEARVEQLGERGSGRSELVARHKREVRRLRTDELRFGLALLGGVYRDRLVAGPDESAEASLVAIQETAENLIRNPNEALMLQALLLRL